MPRWEALAPVAQAYNNYLKAQNDGQIEQANQFADQFYKQAQTAATVLGIQSDADKLSMQREMSPYNIAYKQAQAKLQEVRVGTEVIKQKGLESKQQSEQEYRDWYTKTYGKPPGAEKPEEAYSRINLRKSQVATAEDKRDKAKAYNDFLIKQGTTPEQIQYDMDLEKTGEKIDRQTYFSQLNSVGKAIASLKTRATIEEIMDDADTNPDLDPVARAIIEEMRPTRGGIDPRDKELAIGELTRLRNFIIQKASKEWPNYDWTVAIEYAPPGATMQNLPDINIPEAQPLPLPKPGILERVLPGRAMSETSGVNQTPEPTAEMNLVQQAADDADVEPELVMAIMKAESAFNPQAKSRANAVGLMQVTAKALKDMGYNLTVEKATEPTTNILLGTNYLGKLRRDYGLATVDELAKGYIAGPDMKGDITQIGPYVVNVKRFYDEYKANPATLQADLQKIGQILSGVSTPQVQPKQGTSQTTPQPMEIGRRTDPLAGKKQEIWNLATTPEQRDKLTIQFQEVDRIIEYWKSLPSAQKKIEFEKQVSGLKRLGFSDTDLNQIADYIGYLRWGKVLK